MNRSVETVSPLLLSRRSLLSGLPPLLFSAIAAQGKPDGSVPGSRFVYVGSVSAEKAVLPDSTVGKGKGIYLFAAELATGTLRYLDVMPNSANPWWIAINPAGTFLYSANEISAKTGDTSGSVSAYSIDRSTGRLTLLNTVDSGGSRPAQLSVHRSGKYVFVANFSGNSLVVFPVQSDGSLGSPTDSKHDAGAIGPKHSSSAPAGGMQTNGHDRPRPHMIQADASGQHVISVDLSMDALLVWNFDLEKGVLTPADSPLIHVGAGDGPRHFAFHPNGKLLFSLQEEGGTIASFAYNPATGALTPKQTVSTLPQGFAGTVYTSEIVVSPGGDFVYAANRYYDSIVFFRIGRDGLLTRVGEEWARGDFPRHLAFDPTGRFLYVCNQRSDAITTFAVNKDNGTLKFTGQFTAAGAPAILVFLP